MTPPTEAVSESKSAGEALYYAKYPDESMEAYKAQRSLIRNSYERHAQAVLNYARAHPSPDVETAWQLHWRATARCEVSNATSHYDIEHTGFVCVWAAGLISCAHPPEVSDETFQARVAPWMEECFGPEISADKLERNDRFIEEAVELAQATGYTRERAHQLVDYVFSRPAGEPGQEVGGVMVTLAAHCLSHGLDMHTEAETELARIWTKVEQIREKQKTKPKGPALPIAVSTKVSDEHVREVATVVNHIICRRYFQGRIDGYTIEMSDETARAAIAAMAKLGMLR